MTDCDPPASFEAELARSGPYEWVRSLAKGGMAECHVVRHRELGELRVMKVILPRLLDTAVELTSRLRAEARIVRGIRHPNLVEVLDFGFTASGRAYLVTELLTGRTLKEELRERGCLPLDEVLDIAEQVLGGLEVVHAAGFVHRDVKPDNLFYLEADASGRRRVKILDFGVAKIVSADAKARVGHAASTATGVAVGTPLYFSPEQALAKDVDARSDLYGLGGVMLHLLTGKPPFSSGGNVVALYEAHIFSKPDAPSARVSGIPVEVDEVVLRALAKEKQDRFASAGEMLSAVVAARARAAKGFAPTEPVARIPAKPAVRTIKMNAVASAPDMLEILGTEAVPAPTQRPRMPSSADAETAYVTSPVPREAEPRPKAAPAAKRTEPLVPTHAMLPRNERRHPEPEPIEHPPRRRDPTAFLAFAALICLALALVLLFSKSCHAREGLPASDGAGYVWGGGGMTTSNGADGNGAGRNGRGLGPRGYVSDAGARSCRRP